MKTMMNFKGVLSLLILLLGPLSLYAADSEAEKQYDEAVDELNRAIEEAEDDEFKQREALQAYAAEMVDLSQKYQGDLADQALVESAIAFDMSGNANSADRSLRAAEKRVKNWEIQIMLLKAFMEISNQEASAKRYAETLVPIAKQSKTKRSELLPFLKELDMRREIAELSGSDRGGDEKSSTKGNDEERETMTQEAPDFLARDFDNGVVFSLKDYRGKVVLLDFWATWCGPCIQEMPHVIRAYEKYHDKGFEIIGISLDSDMRTLQDFLDANEIEWRQVCDGKGWKGEIAKLYHVESIPSTFLIDEEGNLIAMRLRGEQLSQRLAAIYGR